MRSLNFKGYLVSLVPALVAVVLFCFGQSRHDITGREARQVFGGLATCNSGVVADTTGKTDCIGTCANNQVYNGIAAKNGTYATTPSCGDCGGTYKGMGNCPGTITITP